MEAKSSDNTSLSAESETSDEADIYGNLGEDFFKQNIIANWKDYTIPDEKDLREIMDTIYENLSTKEDLIQEVLATPRDPQPTQSQPAETQATQTPNSNNSTDGGSSNNGGNTMTPKETKATTPKETKSTNNGGNTATQPPAISPEKQAELDKIKAEDRAKSGTNVDDSRGAGGVNEGAEDAAKGWQWQ